MDTIVCPGCKAELAERQLVSKSSTTSTESCPRCHTFVRSGERWSHRYSDASAADVPAIAHWLEGECRTSRSICERVSDKEWQGRYLWRVASDPKAGLPQEWSVEIRYEADSPSTFFVQMTAAEAVAMADELVAALVPVAADHGLQPHGSRGSDFELEGSTPKMTWGVRQYLSVAPLAPGLLRPIITRLAAAMRDLEQTRRRLMP